MLQLSVPLSAVSFSILVFHTVVVGAVSCHLLSDNLLEGNMKLSFYLCTSMGEYSIFPTNWREKNYSGVLLVVFHAIVNGRWFVVRILINCLFRGRQFFRIFRNVVIRIFWQFFFNLIFGRVFVTYFCSLTGFHAVILWICVPYLLLIIPHIINQDSSLKMDTIREVVK